MPVCKLQGARRDLTRHAQLTGQMIFEQGRIVKICMVTMRRGSSVDWNVCMQMKRTLSHVVFDGEFVFGSYIS